MIIIGYWFDMEIYVIILVYYNITWHQEPNINYAPERVDKFPYQTDERESPQEA